MNRAKIDEAFDKLKNHQQRLAGIKMREMFVLDEERFDSFSTACNDLLLDYSKNKIDKAVLQDLFSLAQIAHVEGKRDAMWSGEPINKTENRSVMHMALRYSGNDPVLVDGQNIMPQIRDVLAAIKLFSDDVRADKIRGKTGQRFSDIVNIGIGGSNLGPEMVCTALTPYTKQGLTKQGLRSHFVSNVDGADLSDILKNVDPASTMFIVASKTFTTDETMTNANSARNWLLAALGENAVKDHFVAVSTNIAACKNFGIDEKRIFGFWDWVGGRYSVWSAIGLPVALAIGFENFEQFLSGAASMDEHFLTAPMEQNLPIIMAMIGIWHRNICDFSTLAILPYDQRMSRFSAYLQQLDMESNGKTTMRSGEKIARASGPIVWGEPGTNGQHAFYQLLHQGSDIVPCDFLIAANPHEHMGDHHQKLVANCFAQSEALMLGKDKEHVVAELREEGMDEGEVQKLAPHKVFPGDRPSNTLIYKQLDPATLGSLIALYEHKVFVQGVIWNINSFDQWGVELGKQLAKDLLPLVKGQSKQQTHDSSTHDSSTLGLLNQFHKLES